MDTKSSTIHPENDQKQSGLELESSKRLFKAPTVLYEAILERSQQRSY